MAKVIDGQIELFWWDEDDDSKIPSVEARRFWCDFKLNPENPFANFIGNEHAVRRLTRAAFAALGRFNHRCSDFPFALVGPASTGKATMARMFAALLQLPFVEIRANSCDSLTDLAHEIADVCEKTICRNGTTLELQELARGCDGEPVGPRNFAIPPLIVFVDQVQALPKKVEQGLLRAFAGSMTTENEFTFDTSHVCWIVATSDEDYLKAGFENFSIIHLKPLTVDQVAQVVRLQNPEWELDVCRLVAQHASTPREAIAYAREMRLEFEMNAGDWKEIADTVAKDLGTQESSPWKNRLGRNRRN